MIDQKHFVENEVYEVCYWYGGEMTTNRGTVQFFSAELPEEPWDRYDGIVLESIDKYGDFPTCIWIPYANITYVIKHRSET